MDGEHNGNGESGNGEKKMMPRLAASQSFSPEEVEVLAQLFAGLRGGRDVSGIIRSKPAQSLMRKTLAMQASIEKARARRSGN